MNFTFIEARGLPIFLGLAVSVLFCIFLEGARSNNYFLPPSTWNYFKHNTFSITVVRYDMSGIFIYNLYPMSVNCSFMDVFMGCITRQLSIT
jgi:hypothetical protein